MPQLLVFVLFFAGVYFLLLRPQQQRVRRQRELLHEIGVGDRVVTAGGLIGRVIEEADDRLLLEIADGVMVEFLRLSISRRLDESESAFVSMTDGAELDGGYEEEEASDSDGAAEPAEPERSAESDESAGSTEPAGSTELAGATEPAGSAEEAPAKEAGVGSPDAHHAAPAVAEPAAQSPVPLPASLPTTDGTTPGPAAPAPGQDPH